MLKKNLVYISFCLLLIFILITCSGCSQNTVFTGSDKEDIRVVASISILADIIENLIKGRGKVDYLVPIGDNPEDYELLPSDMQKISNADVFFLNGWALERGIERALSSNINNKRIVYLTEGITPIPLVGEDAPDPHAWFDVQLLISFYVENILNTIIEIDPEGEEEYRQNAKNYIAKLQELDTWIKKQAETIPGKNRIIVISENALKYYGEAYGFQTEGIWELNAHEEGTPQQISRIVDLVKEKNLPAVFVESTLDKRYMKTISNETGVPAAGIIYTDALGLPGSGAETYIEMMRHNTNTFVKGLFP